MKKILNKRNCHKIISNSRYIAVLGAGVSILDTGSLELIHHFEGIRYIHGGIFLNDDVIAVYTGEQRVFFLQISSKSVVWACKRPRELGDSGDMCCCLIPGTNKVAFIARGKKSLDDHYFIVADYQTHMLEVNSIPGVYRVVKSMLWTELFGMTFISYDAKGDGKLLYKMSAIEMDGSVTTICEWESEHIVKSYSGGGFLTDYCCGDKPSAFFHSIRKNEDSNSITLDRTYPLPFPVFQVKSLFGTENKYLPTVSWMDEENGILIACTSEWLGIYNFKSGDWLYEKEFKNICCASIINGKLYVGCAPGLVVEQIGDFYPL